MRTQLQLYESLPAASGRKFECCAAAIDKAKAKGVANRSSSLGRDRLWERTLNG